MLPGLEIAKIHANSIAEELRLEPGDKIIKVNNKPLQDLIAFIYVCADANFSLTVTKKNGDQELLMVEKEPQDELGLQFVQATADGIRHCHNRCCFCFVDQMPPGLRPSLYIKDDDWRLSVLQGNFVTLTNLKPEDMKRLIEQHLSPLYISVHTLNNRLRQQMMGNQKAANIGKQLATLAKAGIEMHCQIVLCPGLNDGMELEYTVEGLAKLYPSVASVAMVPVGLTKFRNDLTALKSCSSENAIALLDWAQNKQERFRRELGCSFFYLSDEFYVLANRKVPAAIYYDGFPQLENGVGLLRQFLDDLTTLPSLSMGFNENHNIALVTGVAAAATVQQFADWCNHIPGLKVQVVTVNNDFWGRTVSVAGLLTGHDVLQSLQLALPMDQVFLPEAMFSADGLTLDNLTIGDLENSLGVKVKTAALPSQIWQELIAGSEYDE